MDDLDNELIRLLRADSRTSFAALAHKTGVTRGTVIHRLRKLEEQQIILKYTITLRPEEAIKGFKAWTGITVDGNQSRAVIASLLGDPSVHGLHDTNGRWDLLAEVFAESTTDLSRALERIRLVRGISKTETSIILKTYL